MSLCGTAKLSGGYIHYPLHGHTYYTSCFKTDTQDSRNSQQKIVEIWKQLLSLGRKYGHSKHNCHKAGWYSQLSELISLNKTRAKKSLSSVLASMRELELDTPFQERSFWQYSVSQKNCSHWPIFYLSV